MIQYTTKTNIPQYTPSLDKKIEIAELYDDTKTKALLAEIEASHLSENEKEFLRAGAQRHIRFNYGNIAEYYCQASAEMQDLMEKSALVIIDINDAIRNGYLKLTDNVRKIIEGGTNEKE